MHILTRAGRTQRFGRPFATVFVAVLILSVFYALMLERLILVPTVAQVIGGVLLTLLPVACVARHEARFAGLNWRSYERMVIIAFIAFGTPLCIWHLAEALLRQA